jgi:hypothetical protein
MPTRNLYLQLYPCTSQTLRTYESENMCCGSGAGIQEEFSNPGSGINIPDQQQQHPGFFLTYFSYPRFDGKQGKFQNRMISYANFLLPLFLSNSTERFLAAACSCTFITAALKCIKTFFTLCFAAYKIFFHSSMDTTALYSLLFSSPVPSFLNPRGPFIHG